jgi:hypothetical protein
MFVGEAQQAVKNESRKYERQAHGALIAQKNHRLKD